MAEQEELRLTVTLVDNASAGVVQLRREVQQLGSGASAAHMESFRRKQAELGAGVKELTEAAISGEKAMLGYIGKFGALGLAAAAGINQLKDVSAQMASVSRQAQLTGVNAPGLQNVINQFEAIGVKAEDAQAMMGKFAVTLAELGRRGSPQREAFLKASGFNSEEMAAMLDRINKAKTDADRVNTAREYAEQLRQKRYDYDRSKAGGEQSEAQATRDAARSEAQFYEQLGLSAEAMERMREPLQNLTAEREAQIKAAQEAAEKIEAAENRIIAKNTQLKESFLEAFGPDLVTMLNAVPPAMDAIVTSMQTVIDRNKETTDALKKDDWKSFLFGSPEQRQQQSDEALKRLQQRWNPPEAPVPHMQHGGIVSRPTVAMIGEAGPEAVLPLSGLGGTAKDLTKEQKENTDQLKKLNQYLDLMLTPGARMDGLGLGGGGGDGVGGRGGIPGFRGLPGAGGGLPDRPGGGRRGGGGGEGDGEGDGAGGGGGVVPGGGAYKNIPGGNIKTQVIGADPKAIGKLGEHSEFLAKQREHFKQEFASDPNLRRDVAAMASLEHSSDPVAPIESLMNRATVAGKSLHQMLYGAFYSTKGQFRSVGGAMSARQLATYDAAEAEALAGSHLIGGATDQGSPGDPNAWFTGGKIIRGGEVYNEWNQGRGGTHAYRLAVERALEQERARAAAGGGAGMAPQPPTPYFKGGTPAHTPGDSYLWPYYANKMGPMGSFPSEAGDRAADRATLDAQAERAVKVEGHGTLTANINAPKGTDVSVGGRGIFRKIQVNRQNQMAPAQGGPVDAGHAPIEE